MRLQILESGHSFVQKMVISLIRLQFGYLPGPIATMSYRRKLFGKHFAAALQEAMRKSQFWSVGEVELFAAFVSKQNACAY